MSGFLDNSVKVYLVKLKIGMLYHTNNTFRNTVFKISVDVPLSLMLVLFPTFLQNVWQFSNQNVLQRGIAVDCWQYIYPYEIWKWFLKRLIFYQKLGLLSKQIKISEGSNFSLKFYACVLLRNAYKKVLRKLYFFWIGRS